MRLRFVLVAVVMALLLALVVTPASAQGTGCGPNVNYLVQRGDTLFTLARRFGTSIGAIASANNIGNINRIFFGTTLRLPCAGQVPNPPAPPLVVPPGTDANGVLPPVIVNPPVSIPPLFVDCTKLRGTSPTDGMAYGNNTFYWNPAPGATSYRVNVYNLDINPNRLVASMDTPATRTWLVINMGDAAGPGFRFAWEVQAMVSDIVVCTTRRYVTLRAANT